MAEFILVDVLLRSTLLLTFAWLAATAIKRAGGSAAMRHLVWVLGIAAVLLLPLASSTMPALPIIPEGIATSVGITAADATTHAVGSDTAQAPNHDSVFDVSTIAWLAYVVIAAVLVARLVIAQCVLLVLWRNATPLKDADWINLLAELNAKFGVKRSVEVRIASAPVMAMTWGLVAQKILLPANAFEWSEQRRQVVLLHELGHVSRQDSLARCIASLACALYWFHPVVWFAARQMRIEQEHSCDDLVLAAGTPARAYARNLLELSASTRTSQLIGGLAAGIGAAHDLEHRLKAIVATAPRRVPTRKHVAGTCAVALASTLLVATAAPVAVATMKGGLLLDLAPRRDEGLATASRAMSNRQPSGIVVDLDNVRDLENVADLDDLQDKPVGSARYAVQAVPSLEPVAPLRPVPALPPTEPAPLVAPVHSVPSVPAVPSVPSVPAVPAVPPARTIPRLANLPTFTSVASISVLQRIDVPIPHAGSPP